MNKHKCPTCGMEGYCTMQGKGFHSCDFCGYTWFDRKENEEE